jgi:hypothetical protein
MCARGSYVCGLLRPCCGVFAFSAVLPSQLPVCGGSFDELTVMFVRFLISVPHCIQVQYVVRQGILTHYPADFLHYSDNISFGIQETCIRDLTYVESSMHQPKISRSLT